MMIHSKRVLIPMQHVIDGVTLSFGVSRTDLLSDRRPRRIVDARHVAMWLGRTYLQLSFPDIGSALRRDHTSVMHGVRRVEADRSLITKGKDIAVTFLREKRHG